MSTLIISGFPGIGKTYIAKEEPFVLDSDSSKFSWLAKGVRNPEFPENYIRHIKNSIKVAPPYYAILVSSHKVVRDALVAHGIKFTLVYPARGIKEEYIQRYKDRGNEGAFVKLLEKNWDSWMDELETQEGCTYIRLNTGQYLKDKYHTTWGRSI